MNPTLGWLAAEWMHEHLPSPADPAKPLVLVDWQLDALLEWYRFDESLAFACQLAVGRDPDCPTALRTSVAIAGESDVALPAACPR